MKVPTLKKLIKEDQKEETEVEEEEEIIMESSEAVESIEAVESTEALASTEVEVPLEVILEVPTELEEEVPHIVEQEVDIATIEMSNHNTNLKTRRSVMDQSHLLKMRLHSLMRESLKTKIN